eukprot:12415468-Ditylum_brightwellii.AAC.2
MPPGAVELPKPMSACQETIGGIIYLNSEGGESKDAARVVCNESTTWNQAVPLPITGTFVWSARSTYDPGVLVRVRKKDAQFSIWHEAPLSATTFLTLYKNPWCG